eukprot:1865256-Prymnesium_polylepis.1
MERAIVASMEGSASTDAAEAANTAGLCANRDGNTAEALRCFDLALSLAPVPRYALSLANMQLKLGDAHGALAHYVELLYGDPSPGVRPLSAAQAEMARRKHAEAEAAVAAAAAVEADLRASAQAESERWLAAVTDAE